MYYTWRHRSRTAQRVVLNKLGTFWITFSANGRNDYVTIFMPLDIFFSFSVKLISLSLASKTWIVLALFSSMSSFFFFFQENKREPHDRHQRDSESL